MEGMDHWDWILLGAVAYVAVTVLVRLMLQRRDRIITHLRGQLQQDGERRREATSEDAGERGDEAA
jgi:hypothetical protein